MIPFGKSIRVYLKDGTVTGIRFGEVVNQTIQCIACPRNRIGELKFNSEANRPSVYFLFGNDENSGEPKTYIGEAENVFERLQSHLLNKEFWNEVIFFVSKDENLTKSHVKFLESRIIQTAITTKRYKIDNGNQSQASSLPAADRDAMEEFLVYLKLLLGVFGHKLLEELTPTNSIATAVVNTSFSESSTVINNGNSVKNIELFLNIGGLKASAVYTDEGVVILKGSDAAKDIQTSLPMGYRETRQKLINNGVLKETENKYIFTDSYLFDTASPAAAIVVGYSINGKNSWKNKNGLSLNEIEKL